MNAPSAETKTRSFLWPGKLSWITQGIKFSALQLCHNKSYLVPSSSILVPAPQKRRPEPLNPMGQLMAVDDTNPTVLGVRGSRSLSVLQVQVLRGQRVSSALLHSQPQPAHQYLHLEIFGITYKTVWIHHLLEQNTRSSCSCKSIATVTWKRWVSDSSQWFWPLERSELGLLEQEEYENRRTGRLTICWHCH